MRQHEGEAETQGGEHEGKDVRRFAAVFCARNIFTRKASLEMTSVLIFRTLQTSQQFPTGITGDQYTGFKENWALAPVFFSKY